MPSRPEYMTTSRSPNSYCAATSFSRGQRPEELEVGAVRQQAALLRADAALADGLDERGRGAGDEVGRAVHQPLDQAQHPDGTRALLGRADRDHLVRPEVAQVDEQLRPPQLGEQDRGQCGEDRRRGDEHDVHLPCPPAAVKHAPAGS